MPFRLSVLQDKSNKINTLDGNTVVVGGGGGVSAVVIVFVAVIGDFITVGDCRNIIPVENNFNSQIL